MGSKRRIDVMLSSTFRDLEQHRAAVIAAMNGLQLTPIAQEFDAALSDSDLIKASLDKVEAADAYVGLIGSRYGQRPECRDRNRDRLSLTELEYHRAVDRGLPRLMFIMADNHELTLADLKLSQAEGDEGYRLQQAFIDRVRKDRIAAEFSSPTDLKAKATTSFAAMERRLTTAANSSSPRLQELPPNPDDNLPTASPAFHYVRKPYVEKQGFAGRIKELKLIDQWAVSGDAMLLFQGIGGMGKSMLTWHWLKNRADAARNDWAGQFWYSFYEQGADLNDFCVHALGYIRRQPPKSFRGRRTLDLGDELRRELDARPWLLVLDGLERVLVAYNRTGKEYMSDEEAVVARDDIGLDREPRDCFRPEDDDVLAMLAQAAKGKLLVSSRLTPTALMNTMTQPIPGVKREALEGLSPEDAEQALRNANIRGDGWRIQHFLEDKFACHPLSVSVVAGQISTFQQARYDFDSWVEHPKGGGDPALIAKDLRGRQNHILSRAFDDLDDDAKALLGSIAMANIELTPDVLQILNPMRPIEPTKVDQPRQLTDDDASPLQDFKHWELKIARDRTTTKGARTAAQAQLDAYRKKDFAARKGKYALYLKAYAAAQQVAREADAWLVQMMPHLEARGLLQYDPNTNLLDMHPAIRHTALIGLSSQARSSTGSHVSDALSSRPIKPFEEARTREDLALVIARVEALNAAEKMTAGWNLFHEGFGLALFRLQYVYELLELVQPYFPQGWELGPLALPNSEHATALGMAGALLSEVGRPQLGSILEIKAIKMNLAAQSTREAVTSLGNFAGNLMKRKRQACAERLRLLATRLAEASDHLEIHWLWVNQADNYIEQARLDEAEAILATLRKAVANNEVSNDSEAHILRCDLVFAFRTGLLSEPMVEASIKRIRRLGQRFDEREALEAVAVWRQANGKHETALDAFGDLIALANETGWLELPEYEIRRALSLAALGRPEEARRIAAKINRTKDTPHAALALLYLELGDRAKAGMHALAGYKTAWGEGPPYQEHWDLEDCRKVLAAIGEPEPVLPAFDPSKVEPFDFEPEVERLIERELAKKARTRGRGKTINALKPP